jgi:glyoxylase-like metal-dependent hydrolase (beta-lactamase superfamily II)/predicted DCC family thiol-disulfide oxidoreductase YuxK
MNSRAIVFYDDQCEICQASVSWLRLLDSSGSTEIVGLNQERLAAYRLTIDACSEQLHIVNQDGQILIGWRAVAYLARLFPVTWIVGTLGAIPPFSWAADALYRWVARNRFALSKCRGGACAVRKESQVRKVTRLTPFWTCRSLGALIRFPLIVAAIMRQIGRNLRRYLLTYRRRIDLLDGRLKLLILNGFTCDLITLLFGEHFVAIFYEDLAIDPGPAKLRQALIRHLRRSKDAAAHFVVATHRHEEHSGNLNWLAAQINGEVVVSEATAAHLKSPDLLPWIRRATIGQPPALQPPFRIAKDHVGRLQVFAAPGHSDDHIVLYDAQERILFAGDAFMGSYFSAPNPDVDSRMWIQTLRDLIDLPIEILIEGHGHIHSLRRDIPDDCPLLIRRNPKHELLEKLRFCEWVRDQVEAGLAEGLPINAIEATCFPWGRRFAWESFLNDEFSRMLSGGHWSRTELVRSFMRSDSVLPGVYETRFFSRRDNS